VMPWVEISEAAAPATSAVEKARLFIVMIPLSYNLHGREQPARGNWTGRP
jgi:hypothetical protein